MEKLLEFEKKVGNIIGLEFDYESNGKFTISADSEPDDKFSTIKFTLTGWKEDETQSTAEKVTLAHINLVRIPSDMRVHSNLGKDYDVGEAMHASTCAGLFTVAEALHIGQWLDFPDETKPIDVFDALIFSDIYHISELFVEKEYRNMGLGTAILHALPTLLSYYCGEDEVLLTLQIAPIDTDENDTQEQTYERLEKFYKSNGFELYDNYVCAQRVAI